MIVSIAAMKVWSTSRVNGNIPLNSEKKPIMMRALCTSDVTPPTPHVQLVNRRAMYAKMAISARITAITASRCISLAMEASTRSEEMIPLGLFRVEVNSS